MMEAKHTPRFTKLDGLRGLLSIIVALNHSFLVIAIPAYANVWGQNIWQYHDFQSKLQQIFMLLGNGGVAVTFFFFFFAPSLSCLLFCVGVSPPGRLFCFFPRNLWSYSVLIIV